MDLTSITVRNFYVYFPHIFDPMQGNNMYFNSVYVSCKIVTEGKESQVLSVTN